ncbi:hypothetical protein [Capybara microvirus Cap3_SP_407]|nr:hypothetical protein [Capybara microvirus Cap3_SP_407]
MSNFNGVNNLPRSLGDCYNYPFMSPSDITDENGITRVVFVCTPPPDLGTLDLYSDDVLANNGIYNVASFSPVGSRLSGISRVDKSLGDVVSKLPTPHPQPQPETDNK